MRITALLRKIHELANQAEQASAIDVDLMLDYTRILYADLLEWREDLREQVAPKPAAPLRTAEPPANEPAPAAAVTVTPPPGSAEPADTSGPQPETTDEPTLEEYMAQLAGTAIHREPALARAAEPESAAVADNPVAVMPPQQAADPAPAPVQPQTAKAEPPAAVSVAPAAPPRPARDIRSMIGINDKYQIMSELFGNDKAAYEQALDMINRAESEQAAFNWLRERLWVTEDHSDAAMIFFDVVRRFKSS